MQHSRRSVTKSNANQSKSTIIHPNSKQQLKQSIRTITTSKPKLLLSLHHKLSNCNSFQSQNQQQQQQQPHFFSTSSHSPLQHAINNGTLDLTVSEPISHLKCKLHIYNRKAMSIDPKNNQALTTDKVYIGGNYSINPIFNLIRIPNWIKTQLSSFFPDFSPSTTTTTSTSIANNFLPYVTRFNQQQNEQIGQLLQDLGNLAQPKVNADEIGFSGTGRGLSGLLYSILPQLSIQTPLNQSILHDLVLSSLQFINTFSSNPTQQPKKKTRNNILKSQFKTFTKFNGKLAQVKDIMNKALIRFLGDAGLSKSVTLGELFRIILPFFIEARLPLVFTFASSPSAQPVQLIYIPDSNNNKEDDIIHAIPLPRDAKTATKTSTQFAVSMESIYHFIPPGAFHILEIEEYQREKTHTHGFEYFNILAEQIERQYDRYSGPFPQGQTIIVSSTPRLIGFSEPQQDLIPLQFIKENHSDFDMKILGVNRPNHEPHFIPQQSTDIHDLPFTFQQQYYDYYTAMSFMLPIEVLSQYRLLSMNPTDLNFKFNQKFVTKVNNELPLQLLLSDLYEKGVQSDINYSLSTSITSTNDTSTNTTSPRSRNGKSKNTKSTTSTLAKPTLTTTQSTSPPTTIVQSTHPLLEYFRMSRIPFQHFKLQHHYTNQYEKVTTFLKENEKTTGQKSYHLDSHNGTTIISIPIPPSSTKPSSTALMVEESLSIQNEPNEILFHQDFLHEQFSTFFSVTPSARVLQGQLESYARSNVIYGVADIICNEILHYSNEHILPLLQHISLQYQGQLLSYTKGECELTPSQLLLLSKQHDAIIKVVQRLHHKIYRTIPNKPIHLPKSTTLPINTNQQQTQNDQTIVTTMIQDWIKTYQPITTPSPLKIPLTAIQKQILQHPTFQQRLFPNIFVSGDLSTSKQTQFNLFINQFINLSEPQFRQRISRQIQFPSIFKSDHRPIKTGIAMALQSSIKHHLHYQSFSQLSPEVETEMIENITESFLSQNPLFITLPYNTTQSVSTLVRSVIKFWDKGDLKKLRRFFDLHDIDTSYSITQESLPRPIKYTFSRPTKATTTTTSPFQISLHHFIQPTLPKSAADSFKLPSPPWVGHNEFIRCLKQLQPSQSFVCSTSNDFRGADLFEIGTDEKLDVLSINIVEEKDRTQLDEVVLPSQNRLMQLFQVAFHIDISSLPPHKQPKDFRALWQHAITHHQLNNLPTQNIRIVFTLLDKTSIKRHPITLYYENKNDQEMFDEIYHMCTDDLFGDVKRTTVSNFEKK